MGVVPMKIICGHSFFWIGACEFTNIIIFSCQKKLADKYKEKNCNQCHSNKK